MSNSLKLSDILLSIKNKLESVYDSADFYLFNTAEGLDRPSFLIAPVINMTRNDNYYLVNKTISIQVISFMPLNSDNIVGYEEKLQLIDNLEKIFGNMNLNVKDRNLKFNYEVIEVDGETAINIDFAYFDERIQAETTEEIIKNINIKY